MQDSVPARRNEIHVSVLDATRLPEWYVSLWIDCRNTKA